MELKVFEKRDDELKMEIRGEDDTLLNVLEHTLLEDGRVLNIEYNIQFPYMSDPMLYLRTDGTEPIGVLLDACERLLEECEEFKSKFEAASEKTK
ncbi:MAG: DNA-directed RNA polymerase subunit L [Candidatus Methanolliviera hydrocarbonicum]|mgnify:CR=1 FL=1|jgi:DNA-directed RNA polymerase, subunit L|uniref:DNA-directed RNA polymerase subunit Rpo11 n=1 Tax=Candidatus Methanolliviera hydrocarbonicum TaxID=2491085 RepID=A0A520KY14_9EURY|nr:MAG: DNA-directed RNA polymerase subunit L [Candidatus Methanolliviera hydrocarbonicum]